MRRILSAALLALVMSGCSCAHYKAHLVEVRDALRDDVGPKFAAYVDADLERDPLLRANDKALVSDLIYSIDVALGEEGAGE